MQTRLSLAAIVTAFCAQAYSLMTSSSWPDTVAERHASWHTVRGQDFAVLALESLKINHPGWIVLASNANYDFNTQAYSLVA